MLQRTPSYMISVKVEPTAMALRKVLPLQARPLDRPLAQRDRRAVMWLVARKAPEVSKRLLRRIAERNLPAGYDIDTHFKPPYNPWDQRLCFISDADLYKEISQGQRRDGDRPYRARGHHGIVLKSGGASTPT